MKLVADSRGRLTAANLFPPNAAFDATPQPDGSIRIIKLTEADVLIVRPFRINGRLTGLDVHVSSEIIAAAVRAERDEE